MLEELVKAFNTYVENPVELLTGPMSTVIDNLTMVKKAHDRCVSLVQAGCFATARAIKAEFNLKYHVPEGDYDDLMLTLEDLDWEARYSNL